METIKCDKCPEAAIYGFAFQAYDGTLLSPVWNRCREHAIEPLPEMAPLGSSVAITGPRQPSP
jgi:hypothetical protein